MLQILKSLFEVFLRMNELKRVTGDFALIETSPRVFVAYTHYRMMFSNSINVTYSTL